jgi:hypothetical protein
METALGVACEPRQAVSHFSRNCQSELMLLMPPIVSLSQISIMWLFCTTMSNSGTG